MDPPWMEILLPGLASLVPSAGTTRLELLTSAVTAPMADVTD